MGQWYFDRLHLAVVQYSYILSRRWWVLSVSLIVSSIADDAAAAGNISFAGRVVARNRINGCLALTLSPSTSSIYIYGSIRIPTNLLLDREQSVPKVEGRSAVVYKGYVCLI